MSIHLTRSKNIATTSHSSIGQCLNVRQAARILLNILIVGLFSENLLAKESTTFQQFNQHIGRQIHKDKQAFAQASSCLELFYKTEKTLPLTIQQINWAKASASQNAMECHRTYPRGINETRDDFTKTQTFLSVSLTFYEFALVADQNDDKIYSPLELHDLFYALELSYHDGDSISTQVTALLNQFDNWHHARNMDALMHGMSLLYEQGYRVTPADRAMLNAIMG